MMEQIKKFINIKTIIGACVVFLLILFAIISSAIDKKSVQQAYDEFDGSIFKNIGNSLVVSSKTNPNVSVSYSSSDTTALNFSYNVATVYVPESTEGDAEFEVTVTFKKGLHSKSKTYEASVSKDSYNVSTISQVQSSSNDTLVKVKGVEIVGKDGNGYIVTDGTRYLYVSHLAGYLNVGTVVDIRAKVNTIGNKVVLSNVMSVTQNTGEKVNYTATTATISSVNSLSSSNQDAYKLYKFEDVTLYADITLENNVLKYTYYIQSNGSKLYIDAATLVEYTSDLKSELGLVDATIKAELEAAGTTSTTKYSDNVTIELFLSTYSNGTWSALYCSDQF